MSDYSIIQIKTSPTLIQKAEKEATALGFTSVQEMITTFLKRIVTKEIASEYITLSPKAKKRWEDIFADIKDKKNIYEFQNPSEALTFLVADKK